MKQLVQSYKTGELGVCEMPAPIPSEKRIIVRTSASLISAGTEKMIVEIAKKSIVGKVKARPDLAKQVLQKMKQNGVGDTLTKVFEKLNSPIPLGYSCSGIVIDVGSHIKNFVKGDRVACGGAGFANHSEVNSIPENLCVKIPEGISDVEAAFVTVGSIALQGVRQLAPCLGDTVAVVGLGLIGQLTIQLLKANGCRVIGCDPDSSKLKLAISSGADITCIPSQLRSFASSFSNGYGCDGVIIAASTNSNEPVIVAGDITRVRGSVIIVGQVGMDIPRDSYYKKEIDIKLSMSYGPGRYDRQYEEHGVDYPFGFVRWTLGRNFSAFLQLIGEEKVRPKELISHTYDFDNVMDAYELVQGKTKEEYTGIILTYGSQERDLGHGDFQTQYSISTPKQSAGLASAPRTIAVGMIGAGNFARSVILPNLKNRDNLSLRWLCTTSGLTANDVGKKFHFEKITTDPNNIFQDEAIECVIIATRHDSHADLVIQGLESGKCVFVEKPLCISKAELEKIVFAYEGLKRLNKSPLLFVGYNRRFSSHIQTIQNKVGGRPAVISYRINAGPIPIQSWVQDKKVGGGRVVGEACHFVDTCSYIFDSEPISVYASFVHSQNSAIPNEDILNVIVNYANGSSATINYWAYGNINVPKERIEVAIENQTFSVDNFRSLRVNGKRIGNIFTKKSIDKGFDTQFALLEKACLSKVSHFSFDGLVRTSNTTFAILDSLQSNSVVKI